LNSREIELKIDMRAKIIANQAKKWGFYLSDTVKECLPVYILLIALPQKDNPTTSKMMPAKTA